ncbi:unnamed protein product [Paramecium octaurelia]|uniref:Uncharacterized protein n=1 Tax=Paramecium octaurelia TaxID=43137 RepID=A0A8S1TDX8_PAROT|nr:unnamed protein product [Paramecium octaurelia]
MGNSPQAQPTQVSQINQAQQKPYIKKYEIQVIQESKGVQVEVENQEQSIENSEQKKENQELIAEVNKGYDDLFKEMNKLIELLDDFQKDLANDN